MSSVSNIIHFFFFVSLLVVVVVVGGWWLVVGWLVVGWLVVGGWWLVVGGWWLVVGGWWLVGWWLVVGWLVGGWVVVVDLDDDDDGWMDGGKKVHSTQVEDVPLALCQYQGRLLAGVGKTLRVYELGKKKLLKKCENRQFPTFITKVGVINHTTRTISNRQKVSLSAVVTAYVVVRST